MITISRRHKPCVSEFQWPTNKQIKLVNAIVHNLCLINVIGPKFLPHALHIKHNKQWQFHALNSNLLLSTTSLNRIWLIFDHTHLTSVVSKTIKNCIFAAGTCAWRLGRGWVLIGQVNTIGSVTRHKLPIKTFDRCRFPNFALVDQMSRTEFFNKKTQTGKAVSPPAEIKMVFRIIF